MFVVPRCTRRCGGESVLELGDVALIGLVLELLLASRKQPHRSLELLPQLGHEALELEHPPLVLVHVLRDLVDHDEERLARGVDRQHRVDRLDRLAHAAAGPGPGACMGVDPARGIEIPVRIHDVQHVGEVVVGLLLLLGLRPLLLQHRPRGLQEPVPLFVDLQPALVVRDQVALGAVSQSDLDLPQDRGMDVLVVACHPADVEHDRDRIDLLAHRLPRCHQLLPLRGVVAREQSLLQRCAVGKHDAVEREPHELGKARLARAVEARDPGGRELGPDLLRHLVGDALQQAHELLVDTVGPDAGAVAPRPGIALRIASCDDVLGDLGLQPGRALLVEVDDRRNVPGHVGGEKLTNQHGLSHG